MKTSNFASLDQSIHQKGLTGGSKADEVLWNEFIADPTRIGLEMEEAATRFCAPDSIRQEDEDLPVFLPHETEAIRVGRVRRVQWFFRGVVLAAYNKQCAITGLAVPELLIASHIIPWSVNPERRADPTNGILLNSLLDRAFDSGLIAFDDNYRVLVSVPLEKAAAKAGLDCSLTRLRGRSLTLPKRFKPDPAALEYHRRNKFKP